MNVARNETNRSYADEMFESGFGGRPVTSRPPPGLEITEGPFAKWDPNRDPVSYRREKTAETSGRREAQAISVQTGDATVGKNPEPRPPTQPQVAKTSPADDAQTSTKIPKTAGLGTVDFADGAQGMISAQSSKIDAFSLGGGTPPLRGHDIGQLPPAPDKGPRVVGGAPGGGTRGPSSAAARARARAEGRTGKEPVNAVVNQPPPSPQSRPGTDMGAQSLANDRDRSAFVSSGVGGNAQLFSGNGDVQKVGEVTADVGDNAHPLALFTKLGAALGDDWVTWEPETIDASFAAALGHEPSPAILNTAMALKAVVNNPAAFFGDWHGFEKICIVFSGATPHMALIEDLSPEQMAHGVACARRLVGKDAEFSDAMKAYVAARLFDAGLVMAPMELGFANRDLGKLVEDQDLRKRTVTVFAKAMKQGSFDPGDDEALGVQLSRLLRCHAYVADRFDELSAQLA